MNKNKTKSNSPASAMPKRRFDKNVFFRIIKFLFSCYPVLVPITALCIAISAAVSAIPSLFTQNVLAVVEKALDDPSFTWEMASREIIPLITLLGCIYAVSFLLITLHTQLMAFITQGFLCKLRRKMFDGMQNLPIKYFDTNKHGDIMSHYTNDIDTLRQLVSQSLPQLLQSTIIVCTVFGIMLWYSLWMTAIIVVGVVLMLIVSKKIGGGSAKYFIRQQKAIGKTEGFVQEMMSGQKVVKVFCHEDAACRDFDKINQAQFEDSYKAHAYANILGPIIMNIGNVLYVLCAIASGVFLLSDIPNVSISGLAFSISILVPFLNMTKQFTGNVNTLSQQMNSIIMGMAGASRVFALIDTESETDDGYVTLVNCTVDEEGNIHESDKQTGKWAWKHPHSADGSVTYTLLKGDVRLTEVDFAYEEGKTVLHDVSVYAEPGQKVAFVGATGAGKTTITNLIHSSLYYRLGACVNG